MPLWKTKAYNITEDEVRYAMKHTKSNAGAARFLGIHFSTWRRYAKMYVDVESGKTLYDLHSNQRGIGVAKRGRYKGLHGLDKILKGEHPEYKGKNLKHRIINAGIKDEMCEHCGFSERRLTDDKVPLIMVRKDGDPTNHLLENLELICYNCYFLLHDDLFVKRKRPGVENV